MLAAGLISPAAQQPARVYIPRRSHVLGFHVVGYTYGFWLPNDHAGQGGCCAIEVLRQFGPATKDRIVDPLAWIDSMRRFDGRGRSAAESGRRVR